MKKPFIILALLLVFLPLVSSAERIDDRDVEWEGETTHTLSWTSPTASRGDYTITVIDFSWVGQAAFAVTYRGETQYGILDEGYKQTFNFTKNTVYFQGIRITANKVSNYNVPFRDIYGTYPCCPKAEIKVEISKEISQKKPKLELGSSLSWDGRLGYVSPMKIEIKNTGEAPFSEGNITIYTGGLKIADEQELSKYGLTYNPAKSLITRNWYSPFFGNNSINLNISLKTPVPPQNISAYTVTVDVHFKDSEGKTYDASTKETVSLAKTVKIDKMITPETILGERIFDDDKGYVGLGRITVVNIYVTNLQGYPLKSVSLTDNIIDGFSLVDNRTKLQWVFDLNGSEKKDFRYEMKAKKIGSHTAPAAVARWTEWKINRTELSNAPSTRVYGVFVSVSKITEKSSYVLNESINVSVRMENRGDFPVRVKVADILPKNATLISGTTNFSGYLRPQQSPVYISYTIAADNLGVLELPNPQIEVLEKGYAGAYEVVPVNKITILEKPAPEVTEAAPEETIPPDQAAGTTPAPVKTPLPKSLIGVLEETTPWLEGAIPIIMLFISIILMLALHILNRET